MLCESCQKEQATVYVTRIVNDQKSEIHLCGQCAMHKGEIVGATEPGFTFHNILAGLFEPGGGFVGGGPVRGAARCSGCGLTLADFRRLGKVGCGQCYTEFEQALEPLLRRIHRGVEHVGKTPRSAKTDRHTIKTQLNRIREKIKMAVADEQYEEAARLRDEARELEMRLENE